MENSSDIHGLILCGGSGTRLWPLSRKNYPKQFLKLNGETSLLQGTYVRIKNIAKPEHIYFLTGAEARFLVLNQIREIDPTFPADNIIAEPEARNTAPAIVHGMKDLKRKGLAENAPVIVTPSDHHIGDEAAFITTLDHAAQATSDHIVTIGIAPSRAETGYGYIQKGTKQGRYYTVATFKEKPNSETATEYLASGGYLWNAGIYLFTRRVFTYELERHAPEFFDYFLRNDPDHESLFAGLPRLPFDQVVAERSNNLVVFEGSFGWNDLGSFDSLEDIAEKNVSARHVGINSKNITVHNTKNHLVATIGVAACKQRHVGSQTTPLLSPQSVQI